MKCFFIKLCRFLLIIYLCQLLISNVFPAKIPSPAINFNLTKQQGKIEIVFFADSVNDTADRLDKDGGAISAFLERLLACNRIGVLGQPASQPDVYAAYAAYVSRLKPLPEYLIIEINMRAFGEIWDYEPSYQFEDQKRYFRIFADTVFMPFWPFFSNNASFFSPDSLPENKYPNNPIFNKLEKLGFMKDEKYIYKLVYSGDHTKDLIEWNYMYPLTKGHRKIKSLLEIADTFASKKTKLIYYFTPINYQPKKEYMGNNFETQLKKNVNLVKSLLLKKHVTVLDLSMSLPLEAFDWREGLYASEHMAEKGRRFVAESLATEIKKDPITHCSKKKINLK